NPLPSGLKFITHSLDGFEVFLPDLLSKFSNMYIYGSATYYHLIPPNLFHDLLPEKYLSRFRSQKPQQFEFFSRQTYLFLVLHDLVFIAIDDDIPKVQNGRGRAFFPEPSKQGLD